MVGVVLRDFFIIIGYCGYYYFILQYRCFLIFIMVFGYVGVLMCIFSMDLELEKVVRVSGIEQGIFYQREMSLNFSCSGYFCQFSVLDKSCKFFEFQLFCLLNGNRCLFYIFLGMLEMR